MRLKLINSDDLLLPANSYTESLEPIIQNLEGTRVEQLKRLQRAPLLDVDKLHLHERCRRGGAGVGHRRAVWLEEMVLISAVPP